MLETSDGGRADDAAASPPSHPLRQASRMARRLVVHPVLSAMYPVLFLFSQNLREQITVEPVFAPLGVAMLASFGLFAVLWALFRNAHLAGLLATAGIALFFSYGHAWNLVGGALKDERFLAVAWSGLLMVAVVVAVRMGARAYALTTPLNVITGALVVVNLLPIVGYHIDQASGENRPVARHSSPPSADPVPVQAGGPDIYYLIFDRYGSERTLREDFGFDNRPFLEELRSRGFYVADRSTANYLKTAQSLASSLNLDYLDTEALAERAPSPDNWRPVYAMLRADFAVEDFLHARGYRYVHLGSLWPPLHTNDAADENYTYSGLPEFSTELLETTAFRLIAPYLHIADEPVVPAGGMWTGGRSAEPTNGEDPYYWAQYRSTQYQLEWLHRVAELSGPKFVFAHVYLPHLPYVFDREGNYVPRAEQERRGEDAGYIGQVEYANDRILAFVDSVLSRAEDEHPIILIQADEGPAPPRYGRNERDFQWLEATDDELAMKFEILNAYYLPGVNAAEAGLYPTITPVNSFRAVFNSYFSADYALLPDRNWVFVDQAHVYDMHDVTDRVAGGPP